MLGQTLLKLNRKQDALAQYRKAYDLDPNNASYQLALGRAYIESAQYNDAVRLFSSINESALNRQEVAALNQMKALALSKSGRGESAVAALRQAAAANPNDASVQYQYGAAALKSGDTDGAISALERAARLDPSSGDKQRLYIQALLLKGRQSSDASKRAIYGKAVTSARTLTSREASYDNLLLLGEAEIGAGQYDSAVGTLKQAMAKNAGDWLPSYYLGQVYTALQNYDAAESSLKGALGKTRDSSNQVRIWKQLGFVYEKQRDYGQAKVAYQRAGDNASVARVEKNQEISQYNAQVKEQNEQIEEMKREQQKIEEQLKQLPGGPPPPPPSSPPPPVR